MIDIDAIVAELKGMVEAKPKTVDDPLAQFEGKDIEYAKDGSSATIKGDNGAMLTVTPDGNYRVEYR